MPAAEARIRTTRPGRDLIELSKALGGDLYLRPGVPSRLDVGDASCTLRAGPGALILRVEAADHDSLHRIEQLVVDEVRRARHDAEITWHRVEATIPPTRVAIGLLAVIALVVLLVRPWNDVLAAWR